MQPLISPPALPGSPTPLVRPERDARVDRVLGDQLFRQQRGIFPWWYCLTAPADTPAGASFARRDRVRRGRLANALMLVLLIVSAIGFFGSNHTIPIVTTTMLSAILLSIPLNQRGWIEIVGLVMALGLTGGMSTSMLAASRLPTKIFSTCSSFLTPRSVNYSVWSIPISRCPSSFSV